MIMDNLDQWRRYTAKGTRLAKAFAFLEKFDLGMASGRHEIDGDDVFALVQKHPTKLTPETSVMEAHQIYIDVHYMAAGRETIYWAPLAACTEMTQAYTAEHEAALFRFVPSSTPLRLGVGQFAVLFPRDAHAPCCIWDQACDVTKVVVKVRDN